MSDNGLEPSWDFSRNVCFAVKLPCEKQGALTQGEGALVESAGIEPATNRRYSDRSTN
ncbi:hypothetical protein [Microseira wollei]|uniref:hypothetical protein n=1 Tax=Microseira wollei TaxID=467598 RepID=UPI001CFD6C17|nr:hypothetical protein [Microseira wollei]